MKNKMHATGSEFGETRLHVDGGYFDRCIFEGTTMIYSGGNFPVFDNCVFRSTMWAFEGPAGNTVEFMRNLYLSPFRPIVEDTFNYIRKDPVKTEGK